MIVKLWWPISIISIWGSEGLVKLELLLRLGAQSLTLLSTLRDPMQLRRRQCTTRRGQDILFIHDY